MVLLWHSMLRDMKTHSQKQPLLRRLLKIIELLLKISSANQRIWDRVKLIEDQISFTVSKMFKVMTHGMLADVFTVSQPQKRLNQTTILANQ
jgi:hypothetical protein